MSISRLLRYTPVWLALTVGACSMEGGPDADTRDAILEHRQVLTLDGHEIVLGRIAGVVAGADGRIYVADAGRREIAVFDTAGIRIATLGRHGRGPGEFEAINSIAWHGDTLAVLDGQTRRITFFPADGGDASSLPWPGAAGRPLRLHSTGEGVIAAGTVMRGPPILATSAAAAAEVFRQPDLVYARLASGGFEGLAAVHDTLAEPRGLDCDADNGIIVIMDAPVFGFIGPLRAFPAPDRIAIAAREVFSVALVDVASGDTADVLTLDLPREPVTDAAWRDATASIREEEAEYGPLDCGRNGERPQYLPMVRSVVADDDGNLWVERRRADDHVVVLFDPAGALLGEFTLPPRDARVPLYVRDGRVYLVTRDEVDVQSIAVLEVGDVDGAD